ncbi:MAG: restriction endonuclease subunit S [Methylophaga sp.]|nr:restriction endonuclease subunit S [Methylophaga sp.]
MKKLAWKIYKNATLIKTGVLEIGDGYRAKNSEFSLTGLPFARAGNIKNGFQFELADLLSEKNVHKAKNKLANIGDCVITTKGTFGRVAFVDKKTGMFVYSPQLCYWRVKNNKVINPRYLYYWLQGPEFLNQAYQIKSSTDMADYANLSDQRNMHISLPDIQVQKKIAAILSAYDDLIENNKRRIALLENMAEEIYREWFVRFRFPGYQTAEFEKGIPKGWALGRIDSLGKVVTGKTPSTANIKYYGGDIPFIKTPDMHGNMFLYETDEKLTEEGLMSQLSQIIMQNSICVSCIGTGGVVSITTRKCSTNQQINSVSLKREADLEWAFFTLKMLKSTILAFGATGATMTNLSKGKFAAIKAIVPPKDLRIEFNNVVKPLFNQIQLLAQANMNLINTRDNLLPRLISGKLSVENLNIQFPPSMQTTAEAE